MLFFRRLHRLRHFFRLPRPPSRWLFAVFGYALAAVALTIGLSLDTPWLGLQLAAQTQQVLIEHSQGPSAAAPAGAALLSVRSSTLDAADAGGGAALQLRAADLMEEPDVLPSYAQMDAFFARQQQIAQVLAQPQVTLHWQTAHASGETVVTPAATRPLHSLPVWWSNLKRHTDRLSNLKRQLT